MQEELQLRAVLLFIGGCPWAPGRSGRGPKWVEVTNELVHLAKTIVLELFEQRRKEVRWLNETQQLDQEEALAYLLADLLDYELLEKEARAVGKAAQEAARAFKVNGKAKAKPGGAKPKPSADQTLKDKASTAKAKARAAAAKSGDAAGLEQRLADIDERLAADRRALAETKVALPWPDRQSVVTQSRPPTATEAENSAAAKLRRLRAAAMAAEEEVAAAEADAVAARRITARAKVEVEAARAHRQKVNAPTPVAACLDEAAWQAVQELRDSAAAEVARVQELYSSCRSTRDECDDALLAAEEVLELARLDVEAEEQAHAQQAAREREDAEWQATLAQLAREHEEATARLEALTAQAAAISVRRESERAELAELEAWRAEEQSAGRCPPEKAFGVEWKTPAAQCKTVSLVGVSPAGIRSLAEQAGVAACD